MLNGPLNDFYSISLDEEEPTFIWEEILPKGEHPGNRSKHALLGGKSKIYLVGGLLKNNSVSNEIFEFDPASQTWKQLKPEGVKFPPL